MGPPTMKRFSKDYTRGCPGINIVLAASDNISLEI